MELGGSMKKKKRIEIIQLARLRELLIAAILERSGEVVALPSASVIPSILKKILKIFLMIVTVFIFLISIPGFDVWFQALITHPFKFLKDQIKFNPFFRIYLFVFYPDLSEHSQESLLHPVLSRQTGILQQP